MMIDDDGVVCGVLGVFLNDRLLDNTLLVDTLVVKAMCGMALAGLPAAVPKR